MTSPRYASRRRPFTFSPASLLFPTLLLLPLAGSVARTQTLGSQPRYAAGDQSSQTVSIKTSAPPIRLPTKAPIPSQFTLRNGLQVVILEDHRIPMIRIHLEVAGAGVEHRGESKGIAKLMASAFMEGTTGRTQPKLAAAMGNLSSDFSVRAAEDSGSLALEGASLVEDAPALLSLMVEVLTRPAFPEEALARLRTERRLGEQAGRGDLNALRTERLRCLVYGDSLPFSALETSVTGGTAATRAEVFAFHRKHVNPKKSALFIVGDVSSDRWRDLTATTFEGWKATTPEKSDLGPSREQERKDAEMTAIVDVPDARTTYLAIGAQLVDRKHPDRLRLEVMNEVLGASTQARLMKRMRWEAAYSYGAGAVISDMWPDRQMWYASTTSSADKSGDALAVMMREIDLMRAEIVPESELLAAKRRYMAREARKTQTPRDLMSLQVALWRNRLSAEEGAALNRRVYDVSAEEVRRVAQQYLARERLRIVAVGNAQQIAKTVGSYGRTAVYDADGRTLNPAQ